MNLRTDVRSRRATRLARRAALAAVAVFGGILVAVSGLAPATAAPAGVLRGPADFVSVAITGGNPNFGYVKQGTSITRTISLLNDGIDGWSMDPAPLAGLVAPFTVVSTTLMAGQEVEPGQTRTITVKYTAPSAGTVSNQTINLKAVDVDNPGDVALAIEFKGQSLDTDRSYFEVSTATGASTVDFGSVELGKTAKVSMKIVMRGIDPMKFADGQIVALNGAGMPIPGVSVSQSPFGAGGLTYVPGQTIPFELSFTPTTAGTEVGTLAVTGKKMSGDPEAKDFVVTLPLRAVAVTPATPTPSPTPMPTPTTPATPGTNSNGGAGTADGSFGAGSGGGSAAGRSGSLASTGAEQVTGLGLGALAVFGCGVAMVVVRRFTRSRG